MSKRWKDSTDGACRLIDNVSGRTDQAYFAGTSTSGGRCRVLSAASTLTHEDNGAILFLSSSTEFATTLPSPYLGAEFTFIVAAAPSGASYTVVTASSANIIKGMQLISADAAADTGTADDTITFVDGQAVAGDTVYLVSDGTSWFAYAQSRVAAGITFTQAS